MKLRTVDITLTNTDHALSHSPFLYPSLCNLHHVHTNRHTHTHATHTHCSAWFPRRQEAARNVFIHVSVACSTQGKRKSPPAKVTQPASKHRALQLPTNQPTSQPGTRSPLSSPPYSLRVVAAGVLERTGPSHDSRTVCNSGFKVHLSALCHSRTNINQSINH